jgi:protein-L-isoaspartate O-methyltransferase
MTDPHATLVRALQSAGLLDDPAWCEAFTAIPRHHFLPYFYGTSGDTWRRFDSQSMSDDDRCRLAYRDQTWVVRLAGPHSQPGQPASSSIQPSLAARMIHELAVTDNDHILEVGTGTGYLTALLCHRLGASNITSIDIDPDLVDSARRTLAELGYTPTLATADGTHGYPDRAPYDRMLGTAAVERVPQSWIDQTRPVGVSSPRCVASSPSLTFTTTATLPDDSCLSPREFCPCERTPLPHQHIRRSCAPRTTRQFSRARYPFARSTTKTSGSSST